MSQGRFEFSLDNYVLFDFQPSQLLPRILHLGYPLISVLPEAEEFLVMLNGFALLVFCWIC
jgi:hypothetical protein